MTIFIVLRMRIDRNTSVLRVYRNLGDARAYVMEAMSNCTTLKVGDDRWVLKEDRSEIWIEVATLT